MKFIIRDDDTCGFTKVEELENCYKNLMPEIPVCLSVTPFRISREGDSFSHNKILYMPYPLDKNEELVSYLREKISNNQVEVSLHGYYHFVEPNEEQKFLAEKDTRFMNKEYLYGTNLVKKTKEGKKYLEELLDCQLTTFVPPSNSISAAGIKAIEKNNLNLITNYSLWDFKSRPLRLRNIVNLVKKKTWTYRNKIKEYPFIYNFGDYAEASYFSLTPVSDINRILKSLKNVSRANGIFILATHYQAFNKKIKSGETIEAALKIIVEEALKINNVEFTTYKNIWN